MRAAAQRRDSADRAQLPGRLRGARLSSGLRARAEALRRCAWHPARARGNDIGGRYVLSLPNSGGIARSGIVLATTIRPEAGIGLASVVLICSHPTLYVHSQTTCSYFQ